LRLRLEYLSLRIDPPALPTTGPLATLFPIELDGSAKKTCEAENYGSLKVPNFSRPPTVSRGKGGSWIMTLTVNASLVKDVAESLFGSLIDHTFVQNRLCSPSTDVCVYTFRPRAR
jgi:hypothetical protein